MFLEIANQFRQILWGHIFTCFMWTKWKDKLYPPQKKLNNLKSLAIYPLPSKKKTVKKFVMCSLKREINRDHECNHRADELLQRMIYCLLCFHHLTLSFLLHLSFFVFFCLLSVFCLLLLLFRTIKVLHWFGYLVTGYARCCQADQYPGLN